MAIGDLIVRVTDLLEAEGRLAKRSVFKLSLALGMLVVVCSVFLAGVALLGVSVYVFLRRTMPADAACAVLGLLLIVMAGLGLGWARTTSNSSKEDE